MYYKVHRPLDGVRLLQSAGERFQEDADYAMTLGTLNSDLFRYDEGKRWYLNAIEGADFRQDNLFASVAHYNLSILESRFYRFDLALEQTNASLASLNRSSGRLARGELSMRQLDFRAALSDYEAAYNMDTSPLSRLNLAQAYQISGRLQEARLYAEDCLRAGDQSWMLNYGIDPVRYRRDIHEILYKTYDGLAATEKLRPYPAVPAWIRSKARGISYWFKGEIHRHLFRKYSYHSAASYKELHPEALTQFYRAFEGYPRRSVTYLREARNFETALVPAAESEYNYEEGRLMRKPALIEKALQGFDPLWERDMIADAFTELIKSGSPRYTEELYRLNPGALRQRGISLPVQLRFNFGEAVRKPPQSRVRGMLKKAGIRSITTGNNDTANSGEPRFVLTLNFEELGGTNGGNSNRTRPMAVYCELFDRERGTAVLSRDILLPSSSRRDCAAFARELADAVFGGN
jgi:tetratricopeptide (TPR) repeat protein